ncbi:MAG: hypothetical protein IKO93_13215 [Lentisphaeria bacterium]|nr:hypothetical protein [Lentisphaeria bacterium]
MYTKEEQKILESLKNGLTIRDDDPNVPFYENAARIGDVAFGMIYKDNRFFREVKLTSQGYQSLPMTKFHSVIAFILSIF